MKNHHLAYLLIASLTLAAGPISVTSASPARDPIPDVDILVKNTPPTTLSAQRALVRRGAQRAGIRHPTAQPLPGPRSRGAVGRWAQYH